jgi:hypothetical protein
MALEFASETTRLRVNAVEPGFSPDSSLHRGANAFQRFLLPYALGSLRQVLEHSEAGRARDHESDE